MTILSVSFKVKTFMNDDLSVIDEIFFIHSPFSDTTGIVNLTDYYNYCNQRLATLVEIAIGSTIFFLFAYKLH